MQKFSVYLYCLNGASARLTLDASYNTIVSKVKELLQDNEGGTAEIIFNDGLFQKFIEA